MYFVFPPLIQAGLAAGQLVQVISKSGVPLSLVRNAATGQFAGQAIGVVGSNPLFGVPNLVLNSYTAYQSGKILDQGRQTMQAVQALAQSVSVLQATTAVIGVGTVAAAALSAVNLYHTLKLRKEVAALRLEVRDGFLDLKQALQAQGTEIIQHIDRVAEDVEFRHHRTILVSAYGRFRQAIAQLQLAVKIQDPTRRQADIQAARNMMFQALADYDNPQLLTNMNAAAYIRRRECVWAIQQAIALTYQLQGDLAGVSHQLQTLGSTMRQDSLVAIAQINSQAELDFLFPELVRIHDHDLQVVTVWEAHSDWLQTVPHDEIKALGSSDWSPVELQNPQDTVNSIVEVPSEQRLYAELQLKSTPTTLCDQLRLMMSPNLRLEYATVISQRAPSSGLNALTLDNLETTSDYAIAHLYHYVQMEAAL